MRISAKKSRMWRPVTLATSRCGKAWCENCELEMIYRVKRMGLVRIMREKLTLRSVLTIHHVISRKTIVVCSISPGKPHKSRLMVDANLYQTHQSYTAHHSQCLVLLEKREYNLYFKCYQEKTHIRVIGCLAAL